MKDVRSLCTYHGKICKSIDRGAVDHTSQPSYARQINVEGTSASLQLDGPEHGRGKMAEFNVRGLSTSKPTKIWHLSFVLLDSRALI